MAELSTWDRLKRKVFDLSVQLEAHTYIEQDKLENYLREIRRLFYTWKDETTPKKPLEDDEDPPGRR